MEGAHLLCHWWGTACGEYILALDKLGVDIKIDHDYHQDLPEEDLFENPKVQKFNEQALCKQQT